MAKCDKLQLGIKEAKHKIRILRQKLQRETVLTPIQVINFAALEGEDGETEEDVLGELTRLRKRQHEEIR